MDHGGGHREQAVALRLAGLSKSQIADELGLKSGGGALTRWLRDVPAPEWTRRPRANDDLHRRAVELRLEGRSYREITATIGVPKSTLSEWLRDVALTEEHRQALHDRRSTGATMRAQSIRASSARRRAEVRRRAREEIAGISERELFVAGVVAYWAEGTKNKPWRTGQSVVFVNSDPDLVRLFLAWLRLVGVADEHLAFRVQIHESADVAAALQFWADVVGMPADLFGKTGLKRHNPRSVRKNVGEGYHGCLSVRVRQSSDLNLKIAGWCEGLLAATTVATKSGVV